MGEAEVDWAGQGRALYSSSNPDFRHTRAQPRSGQKKNEPQAKAAKARSQRQRQETSAGRMPNDGIPIPPIPILMGRRPCRRKHVASVAMPAELSFPGLVRNESCLLGCIRRKPLHLNFVFLARGLSFPNTADGVACKRSSRIVSRLPKCFAFLADDCRLSSLS